MTFHLRQSIHTQNLDHLIDEARKATPKRHVYGDFAKRFFDIAIVALSVMPVVFLLVMLCGLIALD